MDCRMDLGGKENEFLSAAPTPQDADCDLQPQGSFVPESQLS